MLILETLVTAMKSDIVEVPAVKNKKGRKRKVRVEESSVELPVRPPTVEAHAVSEADQLVARWDEKFLTSVKDIIAHMRRWLFTDDVDRGNESSKRARIVRKAPFNASQPRTQEEDVISQSVVQYRRKHAWRSRRISEGPSAQSMPQGFNTRCCRRHWTSTLSIACCRCCPKSWIHLVSIPRCGVIRSPFCMSCQPSEMSSSNRT